jgi:hypothetical protein
VADDHLHAFGGELVRNRHALLRIGDVVADRELQLLPEDAASGVDVLDGLLGPFFNCAPKAAFGPVIGPATPTLICALAAPANARPKPSATADNSILFMRSLLWIPGVEALAPLGG